MSHPPRVYEGKVQWSDGRPREHYLVRAYDADEAMLFLKMRACGDVIATVGDKAYTVSREVCAMLVPTQERVDGVLRANAVARSEFFQEGIVRIPEEP